MYVLRIFPVWMRQVGVVPVESMNYKIGPMNSKPNGNGGNDKRKAKKRLKSGNAQNKEDQHQKQVRIHRNLHNANQLSLSVPVYSIVIYLFFILYLLM